MDINQMHPASGRLILENGDIINMADLYMKPLNMIDLIHTYIHNKKYFDSSKIFSLTNGQIKKFLIKANNTNFHGIVIFDIAGDAIFRSYAVNNIISNGVEILSFNRYVGEPSGECKIYYDTNVIKGDQRFEKLLVGGHGPTSTGSSNNGPRVETVIPSDSYIYFEIENISGNTKNYGITVEWYENGANI